MKKLLAGAIVLLLAASTWASPAATEVTPLLEQALADLGAQPGDAGLCVITDASYVTLGGRTTEEYVDLIQEATGCSIGKGNLLFVQRPANYPLKIALFRRDTKECVVITRSSTLASAGPLTFDVDRAADEPTWAAIQEAVGPADAYSFLIIANAWAAGVPYDFLRCAQLHNHICPGVASGYFLARYILDRYPLQAGERYVYVSCPPWCKDDAIQVLLDLTPGKRSFFVKHLTDEQKQQLGDPDAAGILVVDRGKDRASTALVLKFDWDKARQLSGAAGLEGLPARLQTVVGLVPYYGTPDSLVSVLSDQEITSQQLTRLTIAGVNPYEELGFLR